MSFFLIMSFSVAAGRNAPQRLCLVCLTVHYGSESPPTAAHTMHRPVYCPAYCAVIPINTPPLVIQTIPKNVLALCGAFHAIARKGVLTILVRRRASVLPYPYQNTLPD